jgi:hypothetical protein
MEKAKENRLKIMVYGVESVGFKTPNKPIEKSKYVLVFHSLKTEDDFSDYEGVIFLGETLEAYEDEKLICTNTHEKLKRVKQLFKLRNKGGFICILINHIVDSINHHGGYGSGYIGDYSDTSLAKKFLNDIGLAQDLRRYSKSPLQHFKIVRDEFKSFLADYGTTHSYFNKPYYWDTYEIKPICTIESYYTGMILRNNIFLLPCLAADKDEKSTIKLFTALADALTTTLSKLAQDIPLWVNEEYIFPKEKILIEDLEKQRQILIRLESEAEQYKKIKGCLSFGNDLLVEKVAFVLEHFLSLKVEWNEEYREDLKIFLPKSSKLSAIAEIKGVNAGVSREHINQVDSHRERLRLSSDFPAILVINTKMNATNMKTKDLEIAAEQIKKAVSDNVLILRTLDLLNLIYLEEKGEITKDKIIEKLLKERGWLKTTKENWEVLKK